MVILRFSSMLIGPKIPRTGCRARVTVDVRAQAGQIQATQVHASADTGRIRLDTVIVGERVSTRPIGQTHEHGIIRLPIVPTFPG